MTVTYAPTPKRDWNRLQLHKEWNHHYVYEIETFSDSIDGRKLFLKINVVNLFQLTTTLNNPLVNRVIIF